MTESLTDYLTNLWAVLNGPTAPAPIALLNDSITEDEKELNGVYLFDLPVDSQVE